MSYPFFTVRQRGRPYGSKSAPLRLSTSRKFRLCSTGSSMCKCSTWPWRGAEGSNPSVLLRLSPPWCLECRASSHRRMFKNVQRHYRIIIALFFFPGFRPKDYHDTPRCSDGTRWDWWTNSLDFWLMEFLGEEVGPQESTNIYKSSQKKDLEGLTGCVMSNGRLPKASR